ncbi:uncharacterized protein LOC135331454 [Halichondria panicea]|uniref:uncharacterized protein LOC135331454 n=1 Tax=Halichondria panicea TaxID=6063 RepID=UPI00312B5809
MAATNCSDFYWNKSHVSGSALHNLTSWCPNSSMRLEDALGSPATFLIQLVRLSVSLAVLTLVSVMYNCVNVLDRNVLSTATCSLYWIIYLSLTAVKAISLMIFVPVATTVTEDRYTVNLVGFVLTSLVQTGLTYVLFMALDHERKYRSPDFATFDCPTNRCCVGLRPSRLVCSKWRVVVLLLALLPVALLVALEVTLSTQSSSQHEAPAALAWVYMVSTLSVRAVVLATIVYIVLFTKGNCEPTTIAKVYLVLAAVLSLLEDIPNSLLTVSVHQPSSCSDLGSCPLGVMTGYDLAQLLGAFSLVLYALFVRSQYLRIEEECKLVLIWDMQKLLQVNGRKDSIRHYT